MSRDQFHLGIYKLLTFHVAFTYFQSTLKGGGGGGKCYHTRNHSGRAARYIYKYSLIPPLTNPSTPIFTSVFIALLRENTA